MRQQPNQPDAFAWREGMWVILSCGEDGCGVDDLTIARAARWNAHAAIAGFPAPEQPHNSGWLHKWYPADVDGILGTGAFPTQRACLAALRNAMPVKDRTTTYANTGRGWETTRVTHHRDYVEAFEAVGWGVGSANMMRTYDYACFH